MKVYSILVTTRVDEPEDTIFWTECDCLATASTKEKALELIRRYADWFTSKVPELTEVRREHDGWFIDLKGNVEGMGIEYNLYAIETELDYFDTKEL